MIGLDRERAWPKHGRLFDQMAGTLFRQDPTGIAFEYNPDEYEPKASTILPHLGDVSSQYEALDTRQRVRRMALRQQNGGAKTGYEELAAKVWTARQRYKYSLVPAGG